LYKTGLSYSSVQADTALLEKQQAFDRSKIQERIVHPAGWAAFGEFVVTKDVTHLTKAKLFGSVGKKTPTFTRLSTVTYGREYPDSARNPRGHATKFYTEDGNYDLVGLNFPVFFVRDPFQGPDNIRSQQREHKSFLLNYNGWFDFLANVSPNWDISPPLLCFKVER
jgi:catalase